MRLMHLLSQGGLGGKNFLARRDLGARASALNSSHVHSCICNTHEENNGMENKRFPTLLGT